MPDFIALRGDPSDGLPGAKGIGEKTAADLLRRHGTLEAAIAGAMREKPSVRRALIEQADELRAFKDIATLRDADVERPPDRADRPRGAAPPRRARSAWSGWRCGCEGDGLERSDAPVRGAPGRRVAPGVLRLVDGAVGAGEQVARRVAGPVRPADGDVTATDAALDLDGRVRDGGAQPLGGAQRPVAVGVGQDGDELVAAPAGQRVAAADRASPSRRATSASTSSPACVAVACR